MKIKNTLMIVLMLMYVSMMTSQQIFMETGKNASSFIYKNSQGETLKNMQSTTHSFLNIGFRTPLFDDKLNANFGLGHFSYGTIGSDEALDGILEWNTDYLEFSTGVDYSLFAIGDASFYLKGLFSAGMFLKGNQTLNNELFNLKNADDFNHGMFSFKAGAGFIFSVSERLSFYVQYLIGKSLNQSGNTDHESLRIKSHNIGLGVMIFL